MALSMIYEPISINGAEIPNRIARSAHGTSLADRGAMSDALIAYHAARARGGVGLTILEAAAVHPSTITSFANLDNSAIDGYRRLMAEIRPYGMRVFQQLWHGGHIYPLLDRSPPWGVSDTPNPATGIVSKPMSEGDIAEIIEAYAAAARRCRAGGLDGIEVHAAHGYLVMQFLNPLTNFRTDRYGGSPQNRERFLREILVAIRQAVDKDYPLGVRVGISAGAGGLAEADIAAVVSGLRRDGLIDFINVSYSDYWDHGFAFAMDQPSGYQLQSSGQITSEVPDIPRMVIGRIRTLEEAEQILRDGIADIVHLTRAHIADPDIVRKTKAGTPEQVRPCIGCNQGCWHAVVTGWPIGCTVNPAAGCEGTLDESLLTPADPPCKVLVVGGGPAGMEAARVAALRGHTVTLVEAASDLGGQVLAAKRAPRLHTIGDICFWLEQEISRLGVEIRTNTYVTLDDVLAEKPDCVIVATGAQPRGDGVQFSNSAKPVPGADQAHVVSPEELLMRPQAILGRAALVFDEVGHYEAIAAAEHLLSKGVAVTFVCPADKMGRLVDYDTRVAPAMRRFAGLGPFRLLTSTILERIDHESCMVRSLYKDRAEEIVAYTVVFVTAKASEHGLYEQLQAEGFENDRTVALVGDALAPRDLQFAIAEGHRAGRTLGSASASRSYPIG